MISYVNSKKLNVYGYPLEDCSASGMALTGFTRQGSCTEHNVDAGSHHVCIDISKVEVNGNFLSKSLPINPSKFTLANFSA